MDVCSGIGKDDFEASAVAHGLSSHLHHDAVHVHQIVRLAVKDGVDGDAQALRVVHGVEIGLRGWIDDIGSDLGSAGDLEVVGVVGDTQWLAQSLSLALELEGVVFPVA